ncbi:MAG: hypothetical protein QM523_01140 [Candidatus Pacebacteria bacterium]|nr:hypothetical protein [Candidatus Paceibacterota bacterium]
MTINDDGRNLRPGSSKLKSKTGVDMKEKPYTVVLASHYYSELRVYEVYGNSADRALAEAVFHDRNDYPDRFWRVSDDEGSFEVMRGHNLTEKRG